MENCHPVVSLEAGRGAVHAKTVVLGDLSSLELPGCMAQNDLQNIKRFHMPGVGCTISSNVEPMFCQFIPRKWLSALLCFNNQPTQFLLKFAFSLTHCLIDACISLSQNDKLIHINGLNRYVPVHAG